MAYADWSTGKKIGVIGGGIAVLSILGYALVKYMTPAATTTANTGVTTTTGVCTGSGVTTPANPWEIGYPTIASAAQAVINALLNHGGNVANANSLQSQWNAANSAADGNAMANVLSGAVNELKRQFMNKRPSAASQATFNAAYNDGMQTAAAIEALVMVNNPSAITNNAGVMVNSFVNP